ncbi:MAG: 16S rRNA (guanine(966)-N(2))-methyltransferase RsmD [Candidatus Methylumidiphilus sp.]
MNNELRIIGGVWRSRKIRFPDAPGLRPTPGRVRETLFNWLRQDLEGLNCLNLYAGSGVLGFEAASRGARRVVQVERDTAACLAMRQNSALLQADAVDVVSSEVARFLQNPAEAFDVVFLDPPFRQDRASADCRRLESQGWLADDARIYIETERGLVLAGLPENWDLLRDKQAGEVSYRLYQRKLSL